MTPPLFRGRIGLTGSSLNLRGARSTATTRSRVAALAHGIDAVPGRVVVGAKSAEIPAVREPLRAFTDLARADITVDALHARSDIAQAVTGRHADCVMTVEAVYLIAGDRGADPATLAARVRGHGEMENQLHRVRDVTCQEDKSAGQEGKRAPCDGLAAGPGRQPAMLGRPGRHRRR
ncbi:hypothetical protein [Streptomyces shenzhenensis]|uniref:hypothetical protein n=1 Tax=Streptomyces shenzhenensis TaxID=943815 RepID=UPI0033F12D3B